MTCRRLYCKTVKHNLNIIHELQNKHSSTLDFYCCNLQNKKVATIWLRQFRVKISIPQVKVSIWGGGGGAGGLRGVAIT